MGGGGVEVEKEQIKEEVEEGEEEERDGERWRGGGR